MPSQRCCATIPTETSTSTPTWQSRAASPRRRAHDGWRAGRPGRPPPPGQGQQARPDESFQGGARRRPCLAAGTRTCRRRLPVVPPKYQELPVALEEVDWRGREARHDQQRGRSGVSPRRRHSRPPPEPCGEAQEHRGQRHQAGHHEGGPGGGQQAMPAVARPVDGPGRGGVSRGWRAKHGTRHEHALAVRIVHLHQAVGPAISPEHSLADRHVERGEVAIDRHGQGDA